MRKLISIILILALVLSSISFAFAEDDIGNPSSFTIASYTYTRNQFPFDNNPRISFYDAVYTIYFLYDHVPDIMPYIKATGDWGKYLSKYCDSAPLYTSVLNYIVGGYTPDRFAKDLAMAQSDGYLNDVPLTPDIIQGNNKKDLNDLLGGGYADGNSYNQSSGNSGYTNRSANYLSPIDGAFTFYQILGSFLKDCDQSGYNSLFSFKDLNFKLNSISFQNSLGYDLGYFTDKNNNLLLGASSLLSLDLGDFGSIGAPDVVFNKLRSDKGYTFEWYPHTSTIIIRGGQNSIIAKHIVSGTGNNLSISGTGQGLETLKYYYTETLSDSQNAELLSNIITQGINNSDLLVQLSKIASGAAIQTGVFTDGVLNSNFTLNNDQSIGQLVYSPSTQSYVYHTENYTYEITNNYNYTHINYYMPGTDVPFSQKDFYFELPDGRNSMELSASDVYGMVFDFDVVNYDYVASDPYMQSLYHFNGDTYNDALPVGYDVVSYSIGPVPIDGYGNWLDISSFPDGVNVTLTFSSRYSFSNTFVFDQNGNILAIVSTSNPSFTFLNNGVTRVRTNGANTTVVASYTEVVSSDTVLINPGSLDFSLNPSYSFVSTGLDSYDTALYFDGLAHNFTFNTPVFSLTRDTDFTVSYRWYQEQSTYSGDHVLTIGGTNTLTFNGSKFTNFNGSTISVDIPYGTWNTITIVRSGDNLLLFVNGLLISTTSFRLINSDTINFNFSADNNVHYLDELLFTLIPLYTNTHVPRLQPYDSNKVLVVPDDVSANSIAVHSSLDINSYRIGGVRPTFPELGDVYIYLDGNKIGSIQQYDGFGWKEYSGMVFYNGHWYSLENFRFGMQVSDFDNNLISPPESVGGSPTNVWDFLSSITGLLAKLVDNLSELLFRIGDGIGSGFKTVAGLLETAIREISGLLSELVGLFVGLIGDLFSGLGTFFGSIVDGLGDVNEDIHNVGGIFSGIFAVLPPGFTRLFTFALVVLIGISLIALL